MRFAEGGRSDFAVGEDPVSIGRLPDNLLVIDNPAVSARHARVYKQGNNYVLEDLKSTNGTFVNDKPIARHTLLDGDVIAIARHTMTFALDGGDETGTLSLDLPTRPQTLESLVPKTAIPTAQGRIGTITVVEGDTGQAEYVLTAVTTMIGKADTAQIRLKGWLKPPVAAAIGRKGQGFTITPMGGKVTVNGEKVSGHRDLANGDLIAVAGITLRFTLS